MKQIAMVKIPLVVLLVSVLCLGCGHSHSHDHPHDHTHHHGCSHDHGHSHSVEREMPLHTYLAMDGTFIMRSEDTDSYNDTRNLSKVVLSTSNEAGTITMMSFFSHDAPKEKLAQCGYQYIGSRPDPYYFPDKSKTSIWDVFEKTDDLQGDCSKFKYVISHTPHDNPGQMNLRYGDDYEQLLKMSNDEKDDKYNPWWATYHAY